MAIRSASDIIDNLNTDLADNNAGLISARDVRENIKDIVDSINQIVASGDFDSTNPFSAANIRAKITGGDYGLFIAESGLFFPNATVKNSGYQTQPYPGPSNIDHGDLAALDVDDHTQYVNINGIRNMSRNFGLGTSWINSSGNNDGLLATMDDRGLQFEYVDASNETMHVGDKTTIVFDTDESEMYSGKGLAQAWINFNGSGTMSVTSHYNIKSLEKTSTGKFKIYFKDGLFADDYYVAVGNSNSRTDSDSAEDFDINTVGIVDRTSTYLTFLVKNENSTYVDAAVNDLVVFGNHSGVTPSASVTIL